MARTFSTDVAVNASATTQDKMWFGGEAQAVVWLDPGGAFPTTLTLEYKTATGVYVPSVVITAQGMFHGDFPRGLYRVSMVGGAPSKVYVTLVNIPHND